MFPYHPDRYAARSPAARSLLACPQRGHDAVSVARPVLSGHEAMMTARHGENGKMSWAKRRDRKMGGKPFGISGKTGRDEERDGWQDGMRTRRETRRKTRRA